MAESSSSGALDGSFSIIGAHPVQEPEAYESDVFHTTMLAAIQEYWARTRDASSVPSKWRGNITGSAYALYLKKGCLLAKEEWRKYCIRKGLTDTTWGIWHQGNFNFEEITAAIREASPGSSKTAKGKTTKVNLENLESALQSSMRCTKDNIFPALPPRRGPPLENFITVAKEMEKKFDEIFANHILARMLMVKGSCDQAEHDTQTGESWASRSWNTASGLVTDSGDTGSNTIGHKTDAPTANITSLLPTTNNYP